MTEEIALSSRNASNTSTLSRPFPYQKPYRTFQILKTNPLALGSFSVYLLIHPTGGTAPTGSPVYHTSKLLAIRQRPWLPPSFSLFPGGAPDAEIRFKDGKKAKKERWAKIKYMGWEGLVGMKSEISLWKPRKPASSAAEEEVEEAAPETQGRIHVERLGAGRSYRVTFPDSSSAISARYPDGLVWKGSVSAVSAFQGASGEKAKPSAHGNLKLLDPSRPEKGVLAVWQNKTDLSILGNLVLFEELDESGESGEVGAESKVGLEEVVASCMTVVMAERISLRGWVGGLGKGKGKGLEKGTEKSKVD